MVGLLRLHCFFEVKANLVCSKCVARIFIRHSRDVIPDRKREWIGVMMLESPSCVNSRAGRELIILLHSALVVTSSSQERGKISHRAENN